MSKAQLHQPQLKTKLESYAINHLRVFLSSLGRLYQFPGPSLMTIAVIGISLALPAGFYVMLKNAQTISGGWDGAAKISLYLSQKTTQSAAQGLKQSLSQDPRIQSIKYIDKETGLAEFKAHSGLGEALNGLDNNPLPSVLVIEPTPEASSPDALQHLQAQLQKSALVDTVQMDLEWVKKLIGIMDLIQRGLLVLACMLGLAVVLVIGNTIRLDIQNRAREIRVQKLIGATATFIRRPFLYTGFWYGLLGGLLAWLIVSVGLSVLDEPVSKLSGLYDSQFELSQLSFITGMVMVLASILLGLLGSWLAVGRHLKRIEPDQSL